MKVLFFIRQPMPWIHLISLLVLLLVLCQVNALDSLRLLTLAFSSLECCLRLVILTLSGAPFNTNIALTHVPRTIWLSFLHSALINIEIRPVESNYLHLKANWDPSLEQSWNLSLTHLISLEMPSTRKILSAKNRCKRKSSRKTNGWKCFQLTGKAWWRPCTESSRLRRTNLLIWL